MAINIELLLGGHPLLLLRREGGVEGLHGGRVLAAVGGGGGDIHPRLAVQHTGDQLGYQEGGGVVPFHHEADVLLLTAHESAADVVAGVAEVDVDVVAHFLGDLKGMLDEELTQLQALVLGGHAEGPEGQDLFTVAVAVLQPGLGVHDIADDLPVPLQHEGQLGDEVGVGAHHMDVVMLVRAGLVDIPEGLAGQLLHGAKVAGGLETDDDVFHGLLLVRIQAELVGTL